MYFFTNHDKICINYDTGILLDLTYGRTMSVVRFVESMALSAGVKKKQVAQLWQRDRAKLDTFSINVQRHSQNHERNWIFGPPYGGIRGNLCALSEVLTQRRTDRITIPKTALA